MFASPRAFQHGEIDFVLLSQREAAGRSLMGEERTSRLSSSPMVLSLFSGITSWRRDKSGLLIRIDDVLSRQI